MEDYSKYEESIDSEVGSYASFEGKEILVINDRDGDYEEFQTTLNEIKNEIVYYSSTINIYEKYKHLLSFFSTMNECSFK